MLLICQSMLKKRGKTASILSALDPSQDSPSPHAHIRLKKGRIGKSGYQSCSMLEPGWDLVQFVPLSLSWVCIHGMKCIF